MEKDKDVLKRCYNCLYSQRCSLQKTPGYRGPCAAWRDDLGEYLMPPFTEKACTGCTCGDKEGDGLIEFNKSGSKYLRTVRCSIEGKVDVYAILDAFEVTCPARQHAVKKLLCSGLRGKASVIQDLSEARDAVDRAIQMEQSRLVVNANRTGKEGKCHE